MFLLAIFLLSTSCADNSGEGDTSSQQGGLPPSSREDSASCEPESYNKEYEIQITSFFPSATTNYLVPPALCGDEILITDAPSWLSSEKKNAVSIQLDTLEETDLGFFSPEVQADENYYYWMEAFDRASFGIKRTSKRDGTTQLIYPFDLSRQIIPRLSYGDGYLAWIEMEHIDEYSARWHYYGFNCETEEVFPICSTNYEYGPYDPVPIYNSHITCTQREGGAYVINCIDLKTPSVVKRSVKTGFEPTRIFYDGNQLVWTNQNGIFMNYLDGTTERILTGRSRNVWIYASRHLLYTQNFQIFVYDLKTKEQIFTTKPADDSWPEKTYNGWSIIDTVKGRVVLAGRRSGDHEDCYSIEVLTFLEKND